METVQLKANGTKAYEAFGKASYADNIYYASTIRHLQFQKERFQLWARSLGLFQQGHASLDYRVRDAIVIKQSISSMLQMLLENLEELVSVVLGHRSPFEEQRQDKSERRQGNEHHEDASEEIDYSDSEPSSSEDPSTPSDTGKSLNEGDYRLQLIREAIDSLYCLAIQIRNPKNRPQKTLDQMCEHIPSQERAGCIRDLEGLETTIVAYVQRQEVLGLIEDSPRDTQQDILSQYCLEDSWLIRRAGIANARRKLQFTYWKQHTQRLGNPTLEPREKLTMREKNKNKGVTSLTSELTKGVHQYMIQPENSVPQQSMATSATHMPPGFLKPHDAISVISHQSRVSTMVSPKGDRVAWPHPPANLAGESTFFSCPYCFLICPDNYLNPDSWRNHLVHDLHPYHCTYEFCQDPKRLYGSKQEWLDHESQHTRVWHCQNHVKEFETQPEFIEHLKQDHEDVKQEHFSAELLSSVVGPSTKLRRDCPFCPTGVNSLIEMQRHLAFHMERLALLVLPRNEGDMDNDRASNLSYESHEAQQRGRKKSVCEDFGDEEDFTIGETLNEDDNFRKGVLDEDSLPTLLLQDVRNISLWLDHVATEKDRDVVLRKPNEPEPGMQLTDSQASHIQLSELDDTERKMPEVFNRFRPDEPYLHFLEQVRQAPKTRLLQPIRSPAYSPPEPGLLAPGGMEELSDAQGYVEYLGWIPITALLRNDGNDLWP